VAAKSPTSLTATLAATVSLPSRHCFSLDVCLWIDVTVMGNLFQNKYRIPSARIAWHGYDGGAYFVTVCTADKVQYLGKITNGEMRFTEIGQYADKCLQDIPKHFPHVEVPLYVVMPNHIHAIIIINKIVETQNFASRDGRAETPRGSKETQNFASLQSKDQPQINIAHLNHFGPQSKNLASVMRGFKAGVTKYARQWGIPFAWQPRYYDHIIRNYHEINRIAEYIENNVARWDLDELYG